MIFVLKFYGKTRHLKKLYSFVPKKDLNPLIDFHTHTSANHNNGIEILSCHITDTLNKGLYTIGFHPWRITDIISNEDLNVLKHHYINNGNCLAIGECGLDRLHNFSFDRQVEVFRQQIELAHEISAPVIIHCVKSYDEIIAFKKEYPSAKWCVHGFLKSETLAKQLLDLGFYLSIAPSQNWKVDRRKLLEFLPIDRLFIESDGQKNCSLNLRYKILAEAKRMDVEELKLNILYNCKNFFGEKWRQLNG